ncbi:hypothetical protein JCM19238_3177 [Vibrio ponticus]|nr:hypothetical protein JCM19238_3177 [Vibrio ponticus]
MTRPLTPGEVLSAVHRPLLPSEQVDYEWFLLDAQGDWTSPTTTSLNVTSKDITVDSTHDTFRLGVVATLTMSPSTVTYTSKAVTSDVVVQPTGNSDVLSLDASIAPITLYSDSVLSYTFNLTRNGVAETPTSGLTAAWYIIPDLNQLTQPVSSWTPIAPQAGGVYQLNGPTHNGQYVVLTLTYSDGVQTESATVWSLTPVQSMATPGEFAFWYSLITLSRITQQRLPRSMT